MDDLNISNDLGQIPVSRFMTKNVVYATPSTTITNAIQMLLAHKISGLPVIDEGSVCIGVVSEFDLLLQGASRKGSERIKFKKPVHWVTPQTSLRDALILLVQRRVKRLPVLYSNHKLAGIVARRDILGVMYRDFELEKRKP